MDPQQPIVSQPVVKKVLVKKVKVLVKRPVSAPSPATPVAGQPVLVKVPVKRPVQQPAPPAIPSAQTAPTSPQPVAKPLPAVQTETQIPVQKEDQQQTATQQATPPLQRKSFASQINRSNMALGNIDEEFNDLDNSDEDEDDADEAETRLIYRLPDDILEAINRREKVTDKLFLLYVYARIYAEKVAKEEGYAFPQMMVELPQKVSQASLLMDAIDNDLFMAMLDDFVEMAPFIQGMERIMANKAPLEQIIQTEMKRVKNLETLSTAQQILIAYLSVLVDLQLIQEKLNMLNIQEEADKIVDDIKEMEEDEQSIKNSFIKAVESKRFPIDAKKLINNYFTLAKKDPDKAYETLITNPLFFSPIQMERMPRKFFGLIKPSPKDALAVNKRLASFLKNLKA